MPITGNNVLLSIDEFIDNYCLIFNEKAYLNMLTIKANDTEFLEGIEGISATAKLKFLEEIQTEFSIDIAHGIEFLRDLIGKQSDIEKIQSFFDEITRLNKRLASDKSGNDLNGIKRSLENIKNDVALTFNKEYDEETQEKINDLYFNIKNFEVIFNRTLESFIFDKDFDEKVNMRFNTSRIWSTRYGIYTHNLFVSTEGKRYDEGVVPQEICECSYLKTTKQTFINNKVFTPLALDNLVYISQDGRSISCYDVNRKTIDRIVELNDEIVGSGALMYLVTVSYLIVPCRSGIRIINLLERKLVDNIKAEYSFKFDENIDVKSVNVFNNRCYINICDYRNDVSYLYLIRYDFLRKAFVIKCSGLTTRIQSNVVLIYDKKLQQVRVAYLTCDKKLVEINPDTLDVNHEFGLENEPIDTYITNGDTDIHFSYPIISYKGDIYYLSATRRNQLFLYKIDFLELVNSGEDYHHIDDYVLGIEVTGMIVNRNGQLFPSLTNLIIDGRYGYVGNTQLQQTRTIPYVLENRKIANQYSSKDNVERKRNITYIKYDNDFIKLDTLDLRALRVLALCQRQLIACEDFPQTGKYKLYFLDALKERM